MVLISVDDTKKVVITPEVVVILDSKDEVLIIVSAIVVPETKVLKISEVEEGVVIVESLIITSEVDAVVPDGVKISSLDGNGISMLDSI